MSQYLSLLTGLVAYGIKNPEKLAQLWSVIVAAYEAAQRLAEELASTFEIAVPREAGAVLTADEEEAEKQLANLVGTPRGPFGNGKILRWLLSSSTGQSLLGKLLPLITGLGS